MMLFLVLVEPVSISNCLASPPPSFYRFSQSPLISSAVNDDYFWLKRGRRWYSDNMLQNCESAYLHSLTCWPCWFKLCFFGAQVVHFLTNEHCVSTRCNFSTWTVGKVKKRSQQNLNKCRKFGSNLLICFGELQFFGLLSINPMWGFKYLRISWVRHCTGLLWFGGSRAGRQSLDLQADLSSNPHLWSFHGEFPRQGVLSLRDR